MIYQVTIRVNGQYKTIPIDSGHKLDAEFKAVSANGGVVVDKEIRDERIDVRPWLAYDRIGVR